MDERSYTSAMVNKTSNNGHFHTAVGREVDLTGPEGHLRASGDQSGRVYLRVILGQF